MIRREVNDAYWLISQHDHAMLAGDLASQFGNAFFQSPKRRDSVILAVRLHDCGWPLHDDRPTIHPQTRKPVDVFEVDRPIALEVWTSSAKRAADTDAYAGLLVSMHVLALSAMAMLHLSSSALEFDTSNRADFFAINKFQHGEIERQEDLRKQLGFRSDIPLKHGLAAPGATTEDDELAFHFHLLQAMDLLSLCLCCTEPPAKQSQDVLPATQAQPLKLNFRRNEAGVMLVQPWPFASSPIQLRVPYRAVPARTYTNDEDLRREYGMAEAKLLPLIVDRG